MMEPDSILIDIKTCGMTLQQVTDKANSYMKEHPDYEVFMDGDAYSIVARRKVTP